jgi:hypothetical protein
VSFVANSFGFPITRSRAISRSLDSCGHSSQSFRANGFPPCSFVSFVVQVCRFSDRGDVGDLNGRADPSNLPLPPMYTQFHPRSPNPPKNRQRVAVFRFPNHARSPHHATLPTPPLPAHPTPSQGIPDWRGFQRSDINWRRVPQSWFYLFSQELRAKSQGPLSAIC